MDNISGKDKEEPKAPKEPKEPSEADEPAEPVEPAEPKSSSEGEEAPAGDEGDDDEIELKIGTETKRVKVGELKTLMATRDSVAAEVARTNEARAAANTEASKASTALTKMLERANERYAPYKDLNLLVLSKSLDEATLVQVQKDMQEAYRDVQFLQSELTAVNTAAQAAQSAAMTQAATEGLARIRDVTSPAHIPNFNTPLYHEIMEFAVSQGMPRALVQSITDASALKLIFTAMKASKGTQAVSATVRPVVRTPTKLLKPTASSGSKTSSTRSSTMSELRKSGSEDAAVAAFMATFSDD
jgi:hypothetical protein